MDRKKFYSKLETIISVADLIESFYKSDNHGESYDKSVRLDNASLIGCNMYFKQASNNWYKSKLNLNLNRCS